ncbi:MAG: transporter substrate-binding domain-containing protein [Paracoccaceae bacterium]|nr:transporter substrate-binding domain-containing protein [Paracoccaceae bacterium]
MLPPTAKTETEQPVIIRIGVRADAAPFSSEFTSPNAYDARLCATEGIEPDLEVTYRGYSVDLCRDFLGALKTRSSQQVTYCFVEVATHNNGTAPNRFEALASGEIDLLCGATTATLQVQSRFRSSLMTFLSTSSFLFNKSSVDMKVREQLPLRIGVLADTTSDDSKNPDAASQHAAVRTALEAIGQDAPVAFDSHMDVAEMLCTPNEDTSGCRNAISEEETASAESGTPPALQETDDPLEISKSEYCVYKSQPVQSWLSFAWICSGAQQFVASLTPDSGQDTETEELLASIDVDASSGGMPSGAVVDRDLKANLQQSTDNKNVLGSNQTAVLIAKPQTGDNLGTKLAVEEQKLTTDIPFADRRAAREIDVYVADRPILESILIKAKKDGNDDGIELHTSSIMSQPYAILFPAKDIADASNAVRRLGLDLHLAFNQFLVNDVYAPERASELKLRLKKYFKTTSDRSFINMIPVFARWPTGAPLPR